MTSKSKSPEEAKAFVDYSSPSRPRRTFARLGYRPVNEPCCRPTRQFPTPPKLRTIRELGG